ncbi:MAG: exodeoxyribonuclease VII small subunit [SAR202 cluster bacterium Io17-Chloro-G9]|nr:MAG: exodeoxyribonuclease VII small subunit [SAR202 cluster bacterium Io17-Chloro-G9]
MTEPESPEATPDPNSLTFEDAFRKLSAMADSLEKGGLTLAEATAKYGEGMGLVKLCNRLLDEAELKITTLKDSYSDSSNVPDDDPAWDDDKELKTEL